MVDGASDRRSKHQELSFFVTVPSAHIALSTGINTNHILKKASGLTGGSITLGANLSFKGAAPLKVTKTRSGNNGPRTLSFFKTSQCLLRMFLICLC